MRIFPACILIPAGLLALGAAHAAASAESAWKKMDPVFRIRHVPAAPAATGRFVSPLSAMPSGELLSGIARFHGARRELEALGVRVGTQAGEMFTFRARPSSIEALLADSRLTELEMERRVRLEGESHDGVLEPPAPAWPAHSARSLASPTPAALPPRPNTGRGVLLGFVDSGIDTRHPDFRDVSGVSRIVAVWDQYGDSLPPAGYDYGRLYDSSAVAAGDVSERDYRGHGTHVAGIAAGARWTDPHDPGAYHAGVAPGADVAMVRTTYLADFESQNVHLVDGVNFIFQLAASRGQDAVVNLSLGSQYGAHDGSTLLERMLSALTGPGRILVVSAGNDGDRKLHSSLGSGPDEISSQQLLVPAYSPNPGAANDGVLLEAWSYSPQGGILKLTSPGGKVFGPVPPGQELDTTSDEGDVSIYNLAGRSQFPDSAVGRGQSFALISISDRTSDAHLPAPGLWTLQCRGGLHPPIYNLWIDTVGLTSISPIPNFGDQADPYRTLTAPGSCDSCITVASYVTRTTWRDAGGHATGYGVQNIPAADAGELSLFSSAGPRSGEGLGRPDVAAPGQAIGSALSRDAFFDPWRILGDVAAGDQGHLILEGTSMSAPYAAGCAALALQVRPHLPPSRVRAALRGASVRDTQTSELVNARWGWGKLDAALVALSVADSLFQAGGIPIRIQVLQNPARGQVRYRIESRRDLSGLKLAVYSVAGRRVWQTDPGALAAGITDGVWSPGAGSPGVPSGIYFLRLWGQGFSSTLRVVLFR